MELSLSIAVANSDGFGTRLCSSGLRDNTRTECANRCNTCTNSYGLQCRTDRAANLYLNRAPSARAHTTATRHMPTGAIVLHTLLCSTCYCAFRKTHWLNHWLAIFMVAQAIVLPVCGTRIRHMCICVATARHQPKLTRQWIFTSLAAESVRECVFASV